MDAVVPTWDMEGIVAGGPGGTVFADRMVALEERVGALQARVDALGPVEGDVDGWAAVIADLDPLRDAVGELTAFAVCSAATDSRSPEARQAESKADELWRAVSAVQVGLDAALDAASDAVFDSLMERPAVEAAAPVLRHDRAGRAFRLPGDLQALKVEMDRESLTGWGRLYDLIQGDLTAEIELDGETKRMGVSQLSALRAHPDREVRASAFQAAHEAWDSAKDLCAHTLTQITGARQQFHDRLGIDELATSLHGNRIERATLDAMWAASAALKPALVRYLEHKATVLGVERLEWFDRDAPMPSATAATLGWDEACATITEAFDAFDPDLRAFADRALQRRWIDAAPRPGRRQGGFCIGLAESRESRIFMTFAGTMDNALTLAHELGHAYHNEVLGGVPNSRRSITSALAETASTFAEATVRDHVLSNADSAELRAFMLDQELQAATAFLMDIPFRYGFERRLYSLRRDGILSADVLSREMVAQQTHTHGGALGSWNELFWCSKLHFYIPSFGFYNWPYTFGYLFSAAVHARAKEAGPGFLDTLQDLLLRTGWQSSEELAMACLGVDLTDPDFWVGAARPIEGQVDAFIAATS